jgi:hypothetical protein
MHAKIGWFRKYRITPIAMQLGSLERVYDIKCDTNYVTRCSYLCNSVHYVKICVLLHTQKNRMDERKWNDVHGNKKYYLNALFSP